MRQLSLIIIFLTIVLGQVLGQSARTPVYKGLVTKKYYSVELSSRTANGKTTYEVNDKKVSKSTYDKYESTRKNMETCCPCILKSYDENDVLIREAVSCTDCGVGVFKEFYPNGNVRLIGQYKENHTNDWKNIWDRGYCNVAEGQWIYFNVTGDTLYTEFWTNGEFIKQFPEQKSNEIWNVELTLNGESVDKKVLTPLQVKQLVITPKYKNNSKTENSFILKFLVSATGYVQNEKSFTIDNFKEIDVLQMLSEVGIPSGKQTYFTLSIYDKGIAISNFYLDIEHLTGTNSSFAISGHCRAFDAFFFLVYSFNLKHCVPQFRSSQSCGTLCPML